MEDLTIQEALERDRNEFFHQLELEKLRFQSVIESAPEAIIVTDEEGYVRICNPIADKIFNSTLMLGKPFNLHEKFQISMPDGTPVDYLQFPLALSLFKGEVTRNTEMILTRPDGFHRVLQVSTAPILDREGNITGVVGVFQDISDIKAVEEERLELLEKVRNANEQLRAQAKELQVNGEELEKRVEERTAELMALNQALHDEIQERKEIEKDLINSRKKLRSVSNKLIDSQESERKLVARELHDSLGASLSAIKYGLENVIDQLDENAFDEKASLSSIVGMVKETMEETRRISTSLRPSILDDLGIVATLEWLCREFNRIYTDIEIKKEIRIKENDLSEQRKIQVYRILQEALNNVAKHSQANMVFISLLKNEAYIELKIQDNGIGFDKELVSKEKKAEKGMGLDSMKERTKLAHGSFEIHSQKGVGTELMIRWPLA